MEQMGPNNRSAISFEAGRPPLAMLRELLNVLQITRLPFFDLQAFFVFSRDAAGIYYTSRRLENALYYFTQNYCEQQQFL